LLGAALVIALVTTLLIYGSMQKRTGAVKEVVVETQPVAVATVDLNWGTVVVKEMVKMEPYLKSSLPAGVYTDMAAVVGRVVVSSIRANEPFLESRVAPQTMKTGGVAAVISSKKRAVAVRVDNVIGVAGFIYPGNRVDVLVTLSRGKSEQPITKMVLENILVLATGSEVQRARGKEEKAAPVDVITLEVTPEEAEKLALSSTEGKLQLALRSLTDTEEVLTQGSSIPTLLTSYSGAGPAAKPAGKSSKGPSVARPAQPAPKVFVVELIHGGKVTTKKFEEAK
jgi:pilus assembly protein CpaB